MKEQALPTSQRTGQQGMMIWANEGAQGRAGGWVLVSARAGDDAGLTAECSDQQEPTTFLRCSVGRGLEAII